MGRTFPIRQELHVWSESGHTLRLPTREVYGRRLELCPDRASREQLVGKSLALHRQRGREAAVEEKQRNTSE